MADKSSLRAALLAARRAMTAQQRAHLDHALAVRLMAYLARHRVAILGVFWPIRGEPDLRPVYALLQARGIKLALPVVDAPDQPLRFLLWEPDSVLQKDQMGIMVPSSGTQVQADALLIPCLGFNASHHRLGYGGGFYDRTLAALPRPLTIGIAYASAGCEFAVEPHDQALDEIITEADVSLQA